MLTDSDYLKTAKDEYDASIKEDEKQPFATGSVFQGLRADLDGSGSARIFIVSAGSILEPDLLKLSHLGSRYWPNDWDRWTHGSSIHTNRRTGVN